MKKRTTSKDTPLSVSVYEFIVRRKKVSANTDKVINAAQVARFSRETIYDEDDMWREKATAIYLNKGGGIIGYEVLSVGGPNSCTFEPKMICRTAIQMMADGVVAVHNHPSGDPLPSQSDIEQMNRLRKALAALDVKLVDSVIITDSNKYFSFSDEIASLY